MKRMKFIGFVWVTLISIGNCLGWFGLLFGIIRLLLQKNAISQYIYNIGAEFIVVTETIIYASIAIIVVTLIIELMIRANRAKLYIED